MEGGSFNADGEHPPPVGGVFGGRKVLASKEHRRRKKPRQSVERAGPETGSPVSVPLSPLDSPEQSQVALADVNNELDLLRNVTLSPPPPRPDSADSQARKVISRNLPTLQDVLNTSAPLFRQVKEELNLTESKEEQVDEFEDDPMFQVQTIPPMPTESTSQTIGGKQRKNKSSPKSGVSERETSASKPYVLKTLTPRLRKQIARLPKPNKEELQKLDEIERSIVLNFSGGQDQVDVDHSKGLYRSLWRLGEPKRAIQAQQGATKARPKSPTSPFVDHFYANSTLPQLKSGVAARASQSAHRAQRNVRRNPRPKSSGGSPAKGKGSRKRPLSPFSAQEETRPRPHSGDPSIRGRPTWPAEAKASNNAPRSQIPDFAGEKEDLEKSQEQAQAALIMHENNLVHVLRDVQRMLPNTAMFEFRMKKSMAAGHPHLEQTLTNLIKRYTFAKLLPGWNRWRDWVLYERHMEHVRAAQAIQRRWFKYLGSFELQERAKQLAVQKARTEKRIAAIIERRVEGVLPMQRVFRGMLGRRRAAWARKEAEAALIVQCAWRAKKCRVVLGVRKAIDLKNNLSARDIQRVFRGWKGRVRSKVIRKIINVQKAKIERFRRLEKIRKRLKHLGAVVLIQAWWRALNRRWVTRALVLVLKRRQAIRIQGWWRVCRSRMRFKELLAARKEQQARENDAACSIQRCWRKCRARTLIARMKQEQLQLKEERQRALEEKKKEKVIGVFGQEISVTKAHRAVFKARKAIDPFSKSREVRAALKIQSWFRGCRARRRVRRKRIDENAVLRRLQRDRVRTVAVKLQARWRGIIARRKLEADRLYAAATKVQAAYRSRRARRALFQIMLANRAAATVQRRWRGRLCRKMMVGFRERRARETKAATVLQCCMRQYLSRQTFLDTLERRRYLHEVGVQGVKEAKAALRLAAERHFLKVGFGQGLRGDGEMQGLFKDVVGTLSRSSNQTDPGKEIVLSNEKFAKLIMQSPSLQLLLDRTQVDIIFAKSKTGDNRAMRFPDFRLALVETGWILYLLPRYTEIFEAEKARLQDELQKSLEQCSGNPEKTRAVRQTGKEKIKATESEVRKTLIKAFTYKRNAGQQALLLRVFNEHLLKNKATEQTQARMEKRALIHLTEAALMLQRRYRGRLARKFMKAFREERDELLKQQQIFNAAAKIQTQWRMRAARQRALKVLFVVVQKCLDPVQQVHFYYNKNTGETRWTKPKMLGPDQDVELVVRLPQKDEEYIVQCAKCGDEAATIACLECRDPFCEDCHRAAHHNIPDHKQVTIETCKSCGYQTATRWCNKCAQGFCCTCFEREHFIEKEADAPESKGGGGGRRGKDADIVEGQVEPKVSQVTTEPEELELEREMAEKRAHAWDPIVKLCIECEQRAVRWRCNDCQDDFCSGCFKRIHRKGKRRGHNFRSLPYQSVTLAKIEDRVLAEQQEQQAAEERAAWRKQKEQERLEHMALRLQAIWRGRKGRAHGQALLKEERVKQRKHWRQKKADDVERAKVSNKVKLFLGMAEVLETDDETTKARKRAGWKGSPWGRAVVNAGVALPFGEPLEGSVFVPETYDEVGGDDKGDEGDPVYYVDINRDWRDNVFPGEFIQLNDQYFQVIQVGDGMSLSVERRKLQSMLSKHRLELEEEMAHEEEELHKKEAEEASGPDEAVSAPEKSAEEKRREAKLKKSEDDREKQAYLARLVAGVEYQRVVLDHKWIGPRPAEPSKVVARWIGELTPVQVSSVAARRKVLEQAVVVNKRKAQIANLNLKQKLAVAADRAKEAVQDKAEDHDLAGKLNAIVGKFRKRTLEEEVEDSDEEDDTGLGKVKRTRKHSRKKSVAPANKEAEEAQQEDPPPYQQASVVDALSDDTLAAAANEQGAQQQDWPPWPWEEHYNEEYQCNYYYNPETGESSWQL